MNPTPPLVHAGQVGWMCSARKRIVVSAEAAAGARQFVIEDLGRVELQALGAVETFSAVFRGDLAPHRGPMGEWLVGDFSGLRKPGVYRATLTGRAAPGREAPAAAWSFPFLISDAAWSRLPTLFLDYVHSQRCGDFEDERRGPCHLDDGVRSDTGAPVDATGGWHDAGDLRKWTATTSLPLLGFFELKRRLGLSRSHWREKPHEDGLLAEDDLLAEAAWGLSWILKMQDPASGMFFEDVGGGGDGRRQSGMSWWYENHAGCCADNDGNRFTDNRRGSGDERSVRTQYNPIAQYTAICSLLDGVDQFQARDPAFSRQCREAALRGWEFIKGRKRDEQHGWTSVISWRLLAALWLHATGVVPESEVAALVSVTLDLQSPEGCWYMDSSRREPYRGIVSSAQPLIALASFLDRDYENPLTGAVRRALERCRNDYILPMMATNPFGIMPYGLFSKPGSEADAWHSWKGGDMVYRYFMPTVTPERVVHGLASHWTSWAHALALLADVLDDPGCREAAFDQMGWLTGSNPLNVSMITGVGCRNASPYSRFYGTLSGGFSVGPLGTASDEISVDMDGQTTWSSGEYWMVPLANTCMALAALLPSRTPAAGKLG